VHRKEEIQQWASSFLHPRYESLSLRGPLPASLTSLDEGFRSQKGEKLLLENFVPVPMFGQAHNACTDELSRSMLQ
jgi:hypothetical protein